MKKFAAFFVCAVLAAVCALSGCSSENALQSSASLQSSVSDEISTDAAEEASAVSGSFCLTADYLGLDLRKH